MNIQELSQSFLRELDQLEKGAGVTVESVDRLQVPGCLEHSLLAHDLTREKLRQECRVARECCVAAVCVAPYYVADAVEELSGGIVRVCAAVGFPNALMSSEALVAEVRSCINKGAVELDIPFNIAAVKSGDWDNVERDILSAFEVARGRACVKAVFEHGVYTDEEKNKLLLIAKRCGADYIKVQNLVSGFGARVEEISFVRHLLGRNVKIKIDGGVRTLEKALELLGAGADRIGLSATKAIVDEVRLSRE